MFQRPSKFKVGLTRHRDPALSFARRLHFERLEDRRLLSVTGDYNSNFVVDTADYVLWRKSVGATGAHPADGNGDNIVNDLDYGVWRENFGDGVLPGAFSITMQHVISHDDFTITWDASPNATTYRLMLYGQPNFTELFFTETLANTSRSFEDFGDGEFYIGVTAINGAGETTATNQGTELKIEGYVFQMIFVTSGNFGIDYLDNYPPFGGQFHGAHGADYQVTQIANLGGMIDSWNETDIVFRALLTVTLTDLPARTGIGNADFVNSRGDIVASGRDQLYSGAHTAPILTQAGNVLAGTNIPVWTGSNADGTWSGITAEDWTNPEAGGATVGNLKGSGSTWLSNGTRAGHLAARLYGIGVPSTPFPELPDPILNSPIADQTQAVGNLFNVNVDDHFDRGYRFYARQSSGLPLPAWLSIDKTTGMLSGTPTALEVGSISIEVTALERDSDYATDHFELTVTAAASSLSTVAAVKNPELSWAISDISSRPMEAFSVLCNPVDRSLPLLNRAGIQRDAALVAWLASHSSVDRHDSSDAAASNDTSEVEARDDIGTDSLDALFATNAPEQDRSWPVHPTIDRF